MLCRRKSSRPPRPMSVPTASSAAASGTSCTTHPCTSSAAAPAGATRSPRFKLTVADRSTLSQRMGTCTGVCPLAARRQKNCREVFSQLCVRLGTIELNAGNLMVRMQIALWRDKHTPSVEEINLHARSVVLCNERFARFCFSFPKHVGLNSHHHAACSAPGSEQVNDQRATRCLFDDLDNFLRRTSG